MDFENPLMKEEAILFGKSRSLVGILTDPPINNGNSLSPAVILLNPGIVHRVGPGRVYVKVARALAAIGFVVLRFDFSGIGDSGVRRDHLPFEKSAVQEAQDAIDWLSAARGIQHFILLGGCSGARIALETACSDPRVVGAILLNFVLAETGGGHADPDRTNRTAGFYYWNFALFDPRSWGKLLTGRANYRNLIRALSAQARSKLTSARKSSHESAHFQAQLRQLADRNVHLTFVCSQGDPCVDDLKEAGGNELKRLCALGGMALKVIPRSDHTFSSLFDHERLLQVILERVGSATSVIRKPGSPPEEFATLRPASDPVYR
jgi:pimeloyl-ACP methyl ester carboxylesterase